jgi:hypothetical protein
MQKILPTDKKPTAANSQRIADINFIVVFKIFGRQNYLEQNHWLIRGCQTISGIMANHSTSK